MMNIGEKISWDKGWDIGIKRIDFEHRIFLELIDSLRNEIVRKSKWDVISRIIREIEKYAEFHFISEENLMESIGYPQYLNHQEAHFVLLERLNIAKHKLEDLSKLVEFIYQWFIEHTLKEDIQIAEYLKEHYKGKNLTSFNCITDG
ncbi:bacteriohemerythrin [Carboxylicivirga marina]|uniref:bacteriohemerythrin n=1 Tax=Carboxylicivirga marina TaxID=2800988 RepID=UPI0025928A27|nr:hemerythrin domain-containing protein [uncultured Carboxylicivirga sp.]